MCDIALNNTIDRKKDGKKGVPTDTKGNLISMEIKVCQKTGEIRIWTFLGVVSS